MNEKSGPEPSKSKTTSQLTRVTRLLHRAQDSLHQALCAAPTYQELEEWTAVSERTIQDWCNNKGRPTAEFTLQLLERIPERHRHEIVDSACRVHPTLGHPRLKCDQTTVSRLKTMVRQPGNLVFIQGESDESRTFLLTAIGHEFLRITTRPHGTVGLDAHEPDWFVPLPGVHYLGNLFHRTKLLEAVKENWPKIHTGEAQLALLNSTGVLLTDFQKQLKELAVRCPVVIAEAVSIKPSVLKKASPGPVHVINVSKPAENGKAIAVTIEVI